MDGADDENQKFVKFAKSHGFDPNRVPLFKHFAQQVLTMRVNQLAPRTLEGIRPLLKVKLLPAFENHPPTMVNVRRMGDWWAAVADEGKATQRNAYQLLSNIKKHDVRYQYIPASPCRI